jgi:tetratricopeptide (TPR) repeat protein
VLVAVLLVGGGVGAWLWLRPNAAASPPSVPADVQGAEVRGAIEAARQKVLVDPKSADAWGNLGLTFQAYQIEPEADRSFEQAATLDPTDPRWPYGRGRLALKSSADAAVPFFRQAAALDSKPEFRSAARLQLAEVLLEQGKTDEAAGLYRSEPANNQRAAFGLALVAVAKGDEKAATVALTALRTSPLTRRRATVQLAALARAGGDAAVAEAYEREASALPEDPPWPDPLLEQAAKMRVGGPGRETERDRLTRTGMAAARAGRFDQAEPMLRESLRLAPGSATAHFNLAAVLSARAESEGGPVAKDRFREAAAEAKRATELKPDFARAYLIWGTCLRHLGEHAAAVEPFRKGVACLPTDAELQLGLGESLLDSGDAAGAESHLENARRLAPNDPRPPKALERLRAKKG